MLVSQIHFASGYVVINVALPNQNLWSQASVDYSVQIFRRNRSEQAPKWPEKAKLSHLDIVKNKHLSYVGSILGVMGVI